MHESAAFAVVGRDPDSIRRATKEILQRPEFAHNRSVGERIQDALAHPLQFLQDVFDRVASVLFGGDGAVAQLIAWLVAAVAVALAVIMVIRLVRTTRRSDVVPAPMALEAKKSAADLLDDAARFEAEGDWRLAIRARHAALVASLADAGVLRRRAGTTAREYAIQLSRNAPRAQPTFDEATSLFEWVWYGDAVPGQMDSDRFKTLSEAVHKQAKK